MTFETKCLVYFLVQASGEFAVLHSPDSVEFTPNGEIEQSILKEMLSTALGYTAKQVTFNLTMLDFINSHVR